MAVPAARAGRRYRRRTRYPAVPRHRSSSAILVGAELNAESERQAAAQAGHPGAQASAEQVESGEPNAR